jgi:hypothetical protein
MKVMIGWVLAAVLLAGCGQKEPPACDGSEKRPANVGKWSGAVSFGCVNGGL